MEEAEGGEASSGLGLQGCLYLKRKMSFRDDFPVVE